MDLMELPVVMIENIFSYLSYDEIARNRLVSRTVNDICMRMLNRGFTMIERRHAMALKSVKAQLPRRESERRYHHLSRHCDILTSIETRISMLNMTYSKFIDNGLCCFIPGKVIDEIRRVLAMVETSATPPRAHEVLQELRDISSMAIEHFDDKISPALRKRLQQGTVVPVAKPPNISNMKPRKAMIKLPSLSEDDSGPPAKLQKLEESRCPSPSTSGKLSPRTRAQCSLAKIRGITNEIRQINNLTKTLDSTLKRRNAGELYLLESKKQKLD